MGAPQVRTAGLGSLKSRVRRAGGEFGDMGSLGELLGLNKVPKLLLDRPGTCWFSLNWCVRRA
jgi:hypothetical protein